MKSFRIVCLGLVLLCCCLASKTQSQDSVIVRDSQVLDRVSFEAAPGTIAFRQDVNALVFDTAQCLNCKQRFPLWQFLGDLKVDSIVVSGAVEAVSQPEQLQGIAINSTELLSTMQSIRTRALVKCFDDQPGDTLAWNRVRQDWVVVPDLSVFFELRFAPNPQVDSVVAQLRLVPEVRSAGHIAIPPPDGWLESLD